MNILYIASTCSRKKYYEYVENKGARVSQQAQKYNLLLAEGLYTNGSNVNIISTRPINQSISSKIWYKKEIEIDNGIIFTYIPFINKSLLRMIFLFFGVLFSILFSNYKKRETVVICDVLNISACLATLIACAIRGYKTVAIVTDVPCHTSNMLNIPWHAKFNLYMIQKFKAYLLLTKQMNDIVNLKKRPYIVLEGHVDAKMQSLKNSIENKYAKKICMYAGTLCRIYGIKNLVCGFIKANIPDTELHIYGDGDFLDELKKITKKYDNVKYCGIAPNETIVNEEMKATLLINPRPTNEEYTKYSFPSKNMEYMLSGTPVLTTRLPGMPQDHNKHVFIIETEDEEGISKALTHVLMKSAIELYDFGQKAREFVLQEKTNVQQAKKLLIFINDFLN